MQHLRDIDDPILIPLTVFKMNLSRNHTEEGSIKRNMTIQVPKKSATFRGSFYATHDEDYVEHRISRKGFFDDVAIYVRQGWTDPGVWKSAVGRHEIGLGTKLMR